MYLENEWGKKVADNFAQKIIVRLDILTLQPYIGSTPEGFKDAAMNASNKEVNRVSVLEFWFNKVEKIQKTTFWLTRSNNLRKNNWLLKVSDIFGLREI